MPACRFGGGDNNDVVVCVGDVMFCPGVWTGESARDDVMDGECECEYECGERKDGSGEMAVPPPTKKTTQTKPTT